MRRTTARCRCSPPFWGTQRRCASLFALAFFIVWEVWLRFLPMSRAVIAPPSAIYATIMNAFPILMKHTLSTLAEIYDRVHVGLGRGHSARCGDHVVDFDPAGVLSEHRVVSS